MTTIDVPIDVTRMSTIRLYTSVTGEQKLCLQGWVNLQMMGHPEGLSSDEAMKLPMEKAKHLGDLHASMDGSSRYDFVLNDDQRGWPQINEFAGASSLIMEKMREADYSWVKNKLESYKSVGINFIPENLPEEVTK